MPATILSASLVCIGAVMLGQAIVCACGGPDWSWLAPAIGLAALMILAIPAIHLPGRSVTVGMIGALAVLAAAGWLAAGRRHLPVVAILLVAAPAALLAIVPFVAAGHAGTIGVSLDNDMATHLLWADGYRSAAVAAVNPLPPDYPLGPHAVVAMLSAALGISLVHAFAGLTLACPILLALTAAAALPGAPIWGRAAGGLLAGVPFLVAGYYGQGSFKELMQAMYVLGLAAALERFGVNHSRARWVPIALLVAGSLCVYSVTGLPWVVAIVGAWLAVRATMLLLQGRSVRAVARDAGRALPAVAIGLCALLIVMVPQLPRLARFFVNTSGSNSTGIEKDSLGNLAGPLPFWEVFGAWNNPDYRLPALDPFRAGMWTGLVIVLFAVGVVWSLRRREWVVPLAAALSAGLWVVVNRTQAPYVAAKGLVILAPLVIAVVVRPLVQRPGLGRAPGWWVIGGPALVVVLLLVQTKASYRALHESSPIGPGAHAAQVQSLAGLIAGAPTLYLGNDDFLRTELPRVKVRAPMIGFLQMNLRPQKAWAYGQAFDFDSLDAATLNQFAWIITTRDAQGSTPPAGVRLVKRTRDFALYRRIGTIAERQTLDEGEAPAARLDCRTRQGRAIVRSGGVAAVRGPVVSAPVPALAPGVQATAKLRLTQGTWRLVAPYVSPRPVEVKAPGLTRVLAPNLDRPGPRWPIGTITIPAGAPRDVSVLVRPVVGWLTPQSAVTWLGAVSAVPAGPDRVVPVGRACGRLVDWYVPARR